MNDKTPLRELKGVGEKTEKLFQKIGITTMKPGEQHPHLVRWRAKMAERAAMAL